MCIVLGMGHAKDARRKSSEKGPLLEPTEQAKEGAPCSKMAMLPSGTTERQMHHRDTCKENSPEQDQMESRD